MLYPYLLMGALHKRSLYVDCRALEIATTQGKWVQVPHKVILADKKDKKAERKKGKKTKRQKDPR